MKRCLQTNSSHIISILSTLVEVSENTVCKTFHPVCLIFLFVLQCSSEIVF